MRTLGVAITTYEREALTVAAFRPVVDDPRIEEITIVDDQSDVPVFDRMVSGVSQWPKVHVHRNDHNLGCYLNKRQSVVQSRASWVFLLDSDNEMGPPCLDALCAQPVWDPETLYLPILGLPILDYRAYEGLTVTRDNVAAWIDHPSFPMALNTGNFFVQRDAYLQVFDQQFVPYASDSLYFVSCWLASGRRALFTPGFQYHHLVHHGYWMQHEGMSTKVAQDLIQKLREGLVCGV